MKPDSWTIDGIRYSLTPKQSDDVQRAFDEYLDGAQKIDEALKDDPDYDGHHLCHLRQPYREVETRFKNTVREIVLGEATVHETSSE